VKPTLLVLAAGLGTRYGGLKQIDPVGPHGQTLIDYSIYGAMAAGFGRVVFVIRHYFEDAFRKIVSSKFERSVETGYIYQELDTGLGDFPLPADRERPWGTGHAILVSRDAIQGPFAVVNADDYYGVDSLTAMAAFLSTDVTPDCYAMIGYILKNTLSEHGGVARGITECDEHMFLRRVVERKGIERTPGGIRYRDDDGTAHGLSGEEIVSVNLWGFDPSLFGHLETHFRQFLRQRGREKGAELYIPSVVDSLVTGGRVKVKVHRTHDEWFGVTYRADAPAARRCIQRLTDRGAYPERLWAER
jgi:NDP-sugar pyrophosphorylase family protein